ncbi:EAL domain-containing protein [Arthrobacter oryzae]|uniref:EAL domain-containing protein n=1 Tax=Arthrobacter oryzae TaxID=409290 RepID=UPI00273CB952|nr:EAL domain-containing protein [Arthrobacter oryzae]WLQ07763.1 EAL domain-containing protein [Arthrobacter oryzae]
MGDPTIRGQARDIIESVLDDTTPQSEWAREQLRTRMESHPGNPERALLEHLMATRSITDEQSEESEPNLPSSDLPLPDEDYGNMVLFTRRSRRRIEAILGDRMLLTAFQPIHELSSRNVVGVEALTRFVSDDGASADHWFNEAAAVGLGADLEFAALQAALTAAEQLPAHVYVALNLSPATCLDPRLRAFAEHSQLALDRIVIELTERLAEDEYEPVVAALAPLRLRGLRVAVDGAGAGFGSMSQVTHLSPDIIKLDRSLIAGIDHAAGQKTLGAAMVAFARQVGADLVAEGIETQAELTAVMDLGMTFGQGYLLGRPSVQPLDWAAWRTSADHEASTSGSNGQAT